jgi:hypothetical protein
MKLLIDDMRNITCDIIARNARAGLACLRAFEIDELVLDHDLGDDVNGYEVLCYALLEKIVPDYVYVITDNPVGLENIARALEAEGFKRLGREFRRDK